MPLDEKINGMKKTWKTTKTPGRFPRAPQLPHPLFLTLFFLIAVRTAARHAGFIAADMVVVERSLFGAAGWGQGIRARVCIRPSADFCSAIPMNNEARVTRMARTTEIGTTTTS